MTTLDRPGRTFHILYFGVLGALIALELWAAIAGLVRPPDPGLDTITLVAALAFIFFGSPLLTLFLGLNLWGAVRYRRHRLLHSIVAVALLAWLPYGYWLAFTMPLP